MGTSLKRGPSDPMWSLPMLNWDWPGIVNGMRQKWGVMLTSQAWSGEALCLPLWLWVQPAYLPCVRVLMQSCGQELNLVVSSPSSLPATCVGHLGSDPPAPVKPLDDAAPADT